VILRRVIDHFRKQEWTAIAIDFLIVVIGVFVGIQVSNWNGARIAAVQEQQYLGRLHDEVETSIEQLRAINELYAVVQSELRSVLSVLYEPSPAEALTGTQCTSIFFSHIYEVQYEGLPTVEELITSGRLSIIGDNELRQLLSRHQQHLQGWDRVLEGIVADRWVIPRVHPEMIEVNPNVLDFGLDPGGFMRDRMDNSAICHLDRMRASSAFKNDLVDNTTRQGLAAWFATRQVNVLVAMHTRLDEILKIDHGDDET
jgi:hypothetical protein